MSFFTDTLQFLNGFRKLSVMILLLITAIVFTISGHISGDGFVKLMSSTTVAYMAFNGIEHMSKAVVEFVKGKINKG